MNHVTQHRRQHGISLVEVMVAIAIALFLAGAVSAAFFLTSRAYTENRRQSQLFDNGRIAMELIGYDLQHLGFMGYHPTPTNLGFTVSADCTGPAAVFDLNHRLYVTTSAPACINDAVPGTSIVVVKLARPFPLTTLPPTSNRAPIYIFSSHTQSVLFQGSNSSPPDATIIPDGEYFEYLWHAYYIRHANGIPTLSRRTLRNSAASLSLVTEDLVEGIDDIHVDPVTNDQGRTIGVQLFVLARATTPASTAEKLQITNRTFTLGTRQRTITSADDDRYPRALLQKSFVLRNSLP